MNKGIPYSRARVPFQHSNKGALIWELILNAYLGALFPSTTPRIHRNSISPGTKNIPTEILPKGALGFGNGGPPDWSLSPVMLCLPRVSSASSPLLRICLWCPSFQNRGDFFHLISVNQAGVSSFLTFIYTHDGRRFQFNEDKNKISMFNFSFCLKLSGQKSIVTSEGIKIETFIIFSIW